MPIFIFLYIQKFLVRLSKQSLPIHSSTLWLGNSTLHVQQNCEGSGSLCPLSVLVFTPLPRWLAESGHFSPSFWRRNLSPSEANLGSGLDSKLQENRTDSSADLHLHWHGSQPLSRTSLSSNGQTRKDQPSHHSDLEKPGSFSSHLAPSHWSPGLSRETSTLWENAPKGHPVDSCQLVENQLRQSQDLGVFHSSFQQTHDLVDLPKKHQEGSTYTSVQTRPFLTLRLLSGSMRSLSGLKPRNHNLTARDSTGEIAPYKPPRVESCEICSSTFSRPTEQEETHGLHRHCGSPNKQAGRNSQLDSGAGNSTSPGMGSEVFSHPESKTYSGETKCSGRSAVKTQSDSLNRMVYEPQGDNCHQRNLDSITSSPSKCHQFQIQQI